MQTAVMGSQWTDPRSNSEVDFDLVTKSSGMIAALFRHKFKEASEEVVPMQERNVMAVEVGLRQIHEKLDEGTYAASIETVWDILDFADYRQISTKDFKDWFGGWYKRQISGSDPGSTSLLPESEKQTMYRKLLTPCFYFDNVEGFQEITKWLGYNSVGHTSELDVIGSRTDRFHLPSRAAYAINTSRGRLRNIIDEGLFDEMGDLLDKYNEDGDACGCQAKCVTGYLKQLRELEIFPLKKKAKEASIETLCQRLAKFDWKPKLKGCCHWLSTKDFNRIVHATATRTRSYWDGLCLQCMDRTNPKTGSHDSDYWNARTLRKYWKYCDIEHGQPTWHFSFLGREE